MSEDLYSKENELLNDSGKPSSWGNTAIGLSSGIARLSRGDLATLRRMDPDALDTSVLWRLLAQKGLLSNPMVEAKWGLVVYGIALMTKTSGEESGGRFAHDASMPVGKALFYGGDPTRTRAFYGDSRLNRLMTAKGPMLRTLMSRMFRMMASGGQVFDWREMARWILSEGYSAPTSERVRRNIAKHYFLAEHAANSQKQTQQEQSN